MGPCRKEINKMEKIPLAFWETLGAAFGKDWQKLSS